MKNRKFVKLISIMSVCLLSLTACGPAANKVDNSVEDKTNLYIMTMDNGYGTNFVTELAKAFEAKHEGVHVDVQVVPNGSGNVAETIRDSEGNNIDIYFNITPAVLAEQMRHAYKGGQALRDLTYLYDMQIPGEDVTLGEKVNASYKKNLLVEGRDTEDTSDDVYYAVPDMIGSMGLFYNETVIDKALGKGNWSVPNTTDELLDLCARLKKKDVYFLMPGGIDGFSLSMITAWWAQYEGYENYCKFYQGIGYNTEKDREEANSNLIYAQPGRLAALETAYDLVNYKTGYATKNSVEIGTNVLSEYQSRFFISKFNYAFYPSGSWVGNEVKSNNALQYDSVVKMMKMPIISDIINSTDSYSGSDAKKLPNITSDKILSQVISYVDGNGELPAGVTEAEVEIVRDARHMIYGGTSGVVCPVYSNAKALADEFLLFMASDEGLKIAKEASYGNYLGYECAYDGLDEYETSVSEVIKDAIYVADFKYHPLFYRAGVAAYPNAGGETLDTALCMPGGMTGKEIFEDILDTYKGSSWESIVSKLK